MKNKLMCKIGFHKWKQVRRYSQTGEIVFVWPGIPYRSHSIWNGVERCCRCGKDVKNRRDLLDFSLSMLYAILGVIVIVLIAVFLVAFAKLAAMAFADLCRIAFL